MDRAPLVFRLEVHDLRLPAEVHVAAELVAVGDPVKVQVLDVDFSRERMVATEKELMEERDAVADLLP